MRPPLSLLWLSGLAVVGCTTDATLDAPSDAAPSSHDDWEDWMHEDDWDAADAQVGLCLDFDADIDVSATQIGAPVSFPVTLTNSCDEDLALYDLRLVDFDGAFAFDAPDVSLLPAGGELTLSLSFTAQEKMIHLGQLFIESSDPRAAETYIELFGQLNDGTRSGAAPTASVAEKNQYIDVGSDADLDGSGSSDPEGDPLTYRWSFVYVPAGSSLTNANIVNDTAAVASFTSNATGKYRMRFVVGDGTSTDKVFSNVYAASAGNTAPSANAGPNASASVGSAASLDGSGSSDPEGDSLSYTWSFASVPAGSSLGNADISQDGSDAASFTPDANGVYNVRMVVSDGALTDKDFVKITAYTGTNDPPVANAGANITDAVSGSAVALDGSSSSDPDGDALSYTWSFASTPAGSALSDGDIGQDGSASASFTPDAEGDYNVRMIVSDGVETDKDFVLVTAASSGTADADGDGYDSEASGGTDCNDGNADINPGATELCDGADNDCDGTVDQGAADASTWYADDDSDTYGDPGDTSSACDQPAGYVSNDTDCDDSDGGVNPGASESCNSGDDDCDGGVDEGLSGSWYADADSDTYGDPGDMSSDCAQPAGYVADDTDCDDTDSSVNPGATETCDGADEDCDGAVDEGAGSTTWYADDDSDTYGDAGSTQTDCSQPAGYVSDDTDCDDTDSGINPGATEIPANGVDEDCDGSDGSYTYYSEDVRVMVIAPNCTDYGCHSIVGGANGGYGKDDFYSETVNVASSDVPSLDRIEPFDTDNSYLYHKMVDTHADVGGAGSSMPLGFPLVSSADLDILETWILEGAPESDDSDADGYFSEATGGLDCDDGDSGINPGATDVPGDGIDQDCDGSDATATYTSADVQAILDANCNGCHIGGGASGGITLDDINDSVNDASNDIPAMDRIEPGDPDNSYIWLKMNNTHAAAGGAGNVMPPGGMIGSGDLDVIETWIDEGAPE